MKGRCASCGAKSAGLCAACAGQIRAESRCDSDNDVIVGLYHYRGIVRGLMLRAKVRSDHPALDLLEELTTNNSTALTAAREVDALMPCPSSLWGRVRGRLDVAYQLAEALAHICGKPLVLSPPELYWRVRKRAQNKSAGRGKRAVVVFGRNRWLTTIDALGDAPQILLIDDVATTGQTLRTVASALPDRCQVRALVFGAGPKLPTSLDSFHSDFLEKEPSDKPGPVLLNIRHSQLAEGERRESPP